MFAGHGSTIAQLRNVENLDEALEFALNRGPHLPGLVALYGFSGFGKTYSATYAANRHRAYYVEVRSTWTATVLCQAILRELGVSPGRRVSDMTAQIAETLLQTNRPLILDEADYIISRGLIEIVRDIHESSGAVIVLIGEERLEAKLRQFERVHNRVVRWVAAEPVDLQDAQRLARLYCPGLDLADDLLEAIIKASEGGCRRIAINLAQVKDQSGLRQTPVYDLAWWRGGALEFYTGRVQARLDPLAGARARPPVTVVR